MDRLTDGRTDGQMDEPTGRLMNRRTDGWIDGQMYGPMTCYKHTWAEGAYFISGRFLCQ